MGGGDTSIYKLYRYCEECGFQALQSRIEYENQTILVKNYGIITRKVYKIILPRTGFFTHGSIIKIELTEVTF